MHLTDFMNFTTGRFNDKNGVHILWFSNTISLKRKKGNNSKSV